jgi:thiamine-phosphate pyrophosphorylase
MRSLWWGSKVCGVRVAIGGITLANARSVMDAGADSVAVIGGLWVKGRRPGQVAEDFLEILR